MKQIKAIIFDMDGLLLDTEPIYTLVTQQILDSYGLKFEWELKSRMMGQDVTIALQMLIDHYGLDLTPKSFDEAQRPLFEKAFLESKPMPFAMELTEKLKSLNIPMAVATSSSLKYFQIKTSNHGLWFECFKSIVTGDEVKACKPAPDLFLEAAKRLNTAPEDCLVFEDAITGVAAAKAAGMSVIAVPDEKMDLNKYQEANLILENLGQFNLGDWGL
ncbi:MAG: HAD-IA family hydrolase [SAR324 cluster bacterium]|nr:HAD-IA family hydrolase [SAR324 cluster bacterium]